MAYIETIKRQMAHMRFTVEERKKFEEDFTICVRIVMHMNAGRIDGLAENKKMGYLRLWRECSSLVAAFVDQYGMPQSIAGSPVFSYMKQEALARDNGPAPAAVDSSAESTSETGSAEDKGAGHGSGATPASVSRHPKCEGDALLSCPCLQTDRKKGNGDLAAALAAQRVPTDEELDAFLNDEIDWPIG